MNGLFKTSACLLKEPENLKILKEALKVVFAKIIVLFVLLVFVSFLFVCGWTFLWVFFRMTNSFT